MKNIRHSSKVLTAGIALALGFAMVGAGCSQNQGNNGANSPATSATAASQGSGMQGGNSMQGSSSDNGMQGNSGMQNQGSMQGSSDNGMQSSGSSMQASGDRNGGAGMQAGVGNSKTPVTDTWITTKVQTELHTIRGLDNGDISAETNNGTVSLMGTVKSKEQMNTVVKSVKSIKGVKNVDTSRLKVGTDKK